MKLISVARWLGVVGLLLGVSVPSAAEVLKIVVNDAIHPITEEYIERALAQAERDKDQALLIELNTPGGLLESTRNIIEKILASPVPVIIYVTPGGSRAASAGFFILESADVAAMAPGTNTGAAHPVTLGGGKVDDVMKEKMENDAAALMRSVVSKRGRNVEVAESIDVVAVKLRRNLELVSVDQVFAVARTRDGADRADADPSPRFRYKRSVGLENEVAIIGRVRGVCALSALTVVEPNKAGIGVARPVPVRHQDVVRDAIAGSLGSTVAVDLDEGIVEPRALSAPGLVAASIFEVHGNVAAAAAEIVAG